MASIVTPAHVHALASAEFSDLPVLVVDVDDEIEVFPQSTAVERGATILTDAAALLDYSGGDELNDTLAAQFAAEINEAHGLTEDGEDTEEFDNTDGYVAAVAIASDVVAGDHCDVSVIERAIVGYRDENGTETPVYGLTDRVVGYWETTIPVDAADTDTHAIAAATELLEAAGWEITGDWEYADNAVYAVIARA